MNTIDVQTVRGACLSMGDVKNTYVNMLGGAESLTTHEPVFTRQWLRDRIQAELPGVKSVLQSNRRKPAVLHCPDDCEAKMVQHVITSDNTNNMKTLYRTAKLVRKSTEGFFKKESPQPSIAVSSTMEDVPVELYTVICWILTGSAGKLETEVRTHVVDKAALTLSQNLMFGLKSKRQVTYPQKLNK